MGSVFLAVYFESLGIFSEIAIEHLLHGFLPNGVDGLLFFVGGNALDKGFDARPELTEVEEAIAIGEVGVGHSAFGNKSVVIHGVDSIVE